MWFNRMKIEEESPEEYGYERIKFNFTESSTTDKTMADVGIELPENLLLCYGDHLGNENLRKVIAKDYNLEADNVIVTVGACMAVFAIYSTLLKPNDHVVVMFPNYPADVDITYSLGCNTDLYKITAENGYKINIDELAAMIKEDTQTDIWCESIVDLYEKGISVSSMSKVFSLAGIRLGWIARHDKEAVAAMLSHRDYNLISCGMLDETIAAWLLSF